MISRVILVMTTLALISGHTKARLYICGGLKGSEYENKMKLCPPNGPLYCHEM